MMPAPITECDMLPKPSTGAQGDYFALKNEAVDLVPAARRAERAFVSLADLEAIRTKTAAVPASKHALESICGASCEIGAH
jgi:hypothetical protein